MFGWLKSLVRANSQTAPSKQQAKPVRAGSGTQEPAAPDVRSEDLEPSGSESIKEFVTRAARLPAKCVVPIPQLLEVIFALDKSLVENGIDRDAAADIRAENLVGLCPTCGAHYTHKTFMAFAVAKSMPGMPLAGGGNVGRLLSGNCYGSSCPSKTVSLFWCPDLDDSAMKVLAQRGLHPDCHSARRGARWPAR